MALIPKPRIDPRDLHTARRKLQISGPDKTVELTGQEREALLRLIRSGERILYPSSLQIDAYQGYFDAMAITTNYRKFEACVANIEAFEEKFCR